MPGYSLFRPAVAGLALAALCCATIRADEYVLKESFESGKRSPTGWRQGADVPGVEYVWANDVASHGKRSLGLKKTENRYFPIAQWLRTIPCEGETPNLEVCLKAKAVDAQKTIVDIQFLDASGEMIGIALQIMALAKSGLTS